jgi:outer membrane protein insertion porin family
MRKAPLIIAVLAAALLHAAPALAQATQTGLRVAVVPYRLIGVTGPQLEQLSNLSRHLLDVTQSTLSAMDLIPLVMGGQTLNLDDRAIEAQARQLGADFLFMPTMSPSGTNYSLSGDLKPLTRGLAGSPVMTAVTTSPEGLSQTAERLLMMVTDHLFGGGAKVVDVAITGSAAGDVQGLLDSLRIRPGGTYNEAKASSDIRRLYSTGRFSSIEVSVTDVPGGKSVNFVVAQRPQIGLIVYEGNEKYDDDDLNDVVGIKLLDVASNDLLSLGVSNLQSFYADKGFPNADVTQRLEGLEGGKAKLVFTIVEGGRMYVDDIVFDGNDFYSDRKLRGQIESSRRSALISWLTGSGKLDREKLNNDSTVLERFYRNNGFLQARVGDPDVATSEDGEGFVVTFPVVEGPRYRVGDVTLGGDLLEDDVPEDILDERVKLRDEKWFNYDLLQEDVNRVKEYYADKGYAYNEVSAVFGEVDSEGRLGVSIEVMPRHLVYYERIDIVGNEKTRDKVIRRHLEVAEGDLTSSSKLRQSQNNLMRSTFFDDVNLVPSPSDTSPDAMNLRVEVKERPTGSFQIGAGYSNYNNLFGVIRLTQDNLFGYGRRIVLEGNVGSGSNYFNFSFTDPWVADLPLMMGVDLFKYYNDYDYYRKDGMGGALRAGYPVFGRFYLTGTYTWEQVKISDVTYRSSLYLEHMMGHSVNSAFTVSLRRDTRNHFFQPTAGSTARLSYTIASGLFGGDTAFNRYEAEYAKWIPLPLFDGLALMGHVELGFQKATRQDGLPVYEKYMLGGINSIRGYDWYEISPKDPLTGENIGGEKMMVMNFELSFPLLAESGLFGVIFYDMGNVWSKDEDYSFSGLKRSYGGGLRYLSPMGPLRIEYGKAMDPDPGEPSGRWEFTMGAMF